MLDIDVTLLAITLIEKRMKDAFPDIKFAAVGRWEHPITGRKSARLQILTLAELFQGKKPDIPWVDASVLKSAKREVDEKKSPKLL